MKKFLRNRWGLIVVSLAMVLSAGMMNLAQAEEEQTEQPAEPTPGGISISISPVTENFNLKPSSTYDGTLKVTNAGAQAFDFEVYSAPYSFALSENDNNYSPDYSSENNYTQIARWVTVKDQAGNYVPSLKDDEESKHVTFTANPGETIEVAYRVTTPDNIPAGGQYAVLFAQTLSKETDTSGISTQGALGMKIYGLSEEGETIQSADIKDINVARTLEKETEVEENGQTVTKNTTLNQINGKATVRNTGNVDFTAIGKLKVTNIFGELYYETPDDKAQVSIIPESELPVTDAWEDTPSFGLFRAAWTITAGSDSKTVEMVIFLIPPYIIVLTIILLTILVIWIIMMIRRRKERRSRFAV